MPVCAPCYETAVAKTEASIQNFSASMAAMAKTMEGAVRALELFGESMARSADAIEKQFAPFVQAIYNGDLNWRELSPAGLLAWRIAAWFGFSGIAIFRWLETCPGAFADEFGEGWE